MKKKSKQPQFGDENICQFGECEAFAKRKNGRSRVFTKGEKEGTFFPLGSFELENGAVKSYEFGTKQVFLELKTKIAIELVGAKREYVGKYKLEPNGKLRVFTMTKPPLEPNVQPGSAF